MASRMTTKELEDRRARAIVLISEKGYSAAEAADAVGVTRQTVYK